MLGKDQRALAFTFFRPSDVADGKISGQAYHRGEAGAFCRARKFEALGHQVKIISPQYVKPFVRRQKNDGNDAEAICIAARQPHIPLVPKKAVEQQLIQALHRARQRMVNHRTAVVSQIRGFLLDRGSSLREVPQFVSQVLTGNIDENFERPLEGDTAALAVRCQNMGNVGGQQNARAQGCF